jgi:16S rRNA (cytosine1402-N4)-methyltransferase
MKHIPVLLQSVLDALTIKSDGTYIDGTLGGGGHAREILARLSPGGRFVGIDKDADILQKTSAELRQQYPEVPADYCIGGFEDIDTLVATSGSPVPLAHLNGVLLDLGWGSHTLTSGKGFSFLTNDPLVMTYHSAGAEDVTAYTIVNEWSEQTIADILYGWGEEPHARKIAAAICKARSVAPIETSGQLAEIIERCVKRTGKTHPATRAFQALRIAVNKEIEILTPALTRYLELLVQGGRLCVITFHSGEDRVVKQLFNTWHEAELGTHISKKVIAAERSEMLANPRARSAKLRVFEKKQ